MADIRVATQKEYVVRVRENAADLGCIAARTAGRKVAIVTDDNVAPLYADEVAEAVGAACTLIIPHGEAHKGPKEYVDILNRLAEDDFGRRDCVIALGGGVVGDLAGFAAATYMRGIGFINVPTSLLAMVDSAVGGKTAINIDYGKNLCGAFYQPEEVYINTSYLSTLPAREMMCGWGEILKYAFLAPDVGWEDIAGDVTPRLIAKCVRYKADIVEADEREQAGVRQLLNLGHTVGHAVERLSHFALSHGECVVKGMAAVLEMSRRYYDLPADVYARALSILQCKGHDLSIPYDKASILVEIRKDKKSNAEGCDMVLIDSNGRGKVQYLRYDEIEELL